MPCCCAVMLFGFFLPRLTLFCLWLTGYVGRAYTTTLWPLLGFFFLPYTTLAYAIAVNAGWGMQGLGLILFAFGLLLDFGVIGGGASSRRRPWRRNSVKREDFYGPPT